MGTVHVQIKSVTPGVWEPGALVPFVIEELAADKPLEAIGINANKAFYYGELPGVSNPRIDQDGRVIDPDRCRRYALSEIAAVCALPEVQEAVAVIKTERKREARVEQLGRAREAKSLKALIATAEAERVKSPLLFDQVMALIEIVDELADRVDRLGIGGFKDRVQRVLPEMPRTTNELKY